MSEDISNIRSEYVYDGFMKLSKVTFNQKRFNGDVLQDVTREVLVRKPVVFLSLYDTFADKLLFVEQHRVGAIVGNCDSYTTVLEPIAGIIDEGESPVDAVIRECKEESGLDVNRTALELIHKGYISSGGSTEYGWFFTGTFDSTKLESKYFGLESEKEDIRIELTSLDQAMRMLKTGSINSMSGALGVYHHALLTHK